MKKMRAIVLPEFGGPELLKEIEVPRPLPRAGEVLIRVKATSVNPVDTKIRKGMLAAIAPEAPIILGCDVAGVVEEVGAGSAFHVGDEVFGCAGGVKGCPGASAEYMVADENLIARKPRNLSFEEAAALPLVSITAWEALVDRADIQPGQNVLIHAGTGGVGHVAVQIAAAKGARVWTTVSSSEKASLAKSLGAHEVIYYREKSPADYVRECTAGKGFDVILDTVGGDNVARCFEAAAINGTVVSISTRTTCDLSPLHAKGLSLHVVFMLIPMLYKTGRARHGAILREIASLCELQKLRPLLDENSYDLENLGAAHARLESGLAVGKVVVRGF